MRFARQYMLVRKLDSTSSRSQKKFKKSVYSHQSPCYNCSSVLLCSFMSLLYYLSSHITKKWYIVTCCLPVIIVALFYYDLLCNYFIISPVISPIRVYSHLLSLCYNCCSVLLCSFMSLLYYLSSHITKKGYIVTCCLPVYYSTVLLCSFMSLLYYLSSHITKKGYIVTCCLPVYCSTVLLCSFMSLLYYLSSHITKKGI